MSSEKVKISEVTLGGAAEYITGSLKHAIANNQTPDTVMLHSAPGIGKSKTIESIAEQFRPQFESKFPNKKFRFIDIRVGAMDPAEIQGVPFLPHNEGLKEGEQYMDLRYSTPQWFPKEDECGILFLDELSNAPIPNQQACYRIVLDRSIQNGTKMPKEFMIIAAGNRKEDKTGAKGLIPALASRFTTHFYIRADKDEFTTYALRNKFDEKLVAFLNFKPQFLVGTPSGDECGYPNPRNWESVSKIRLNPNHSEDIMTAAVYGCIGREAGQDFFGFLQFYGRLPDFDRVERGDTSWRLPEGSDKDLGLRFALMIACAYRIVGCLEEDNYQPAEHLVELLTKNLDNATSAQAIRVVKTSNPKLMMRVLKHGKAVCPKLAELVDNTIKQSSAKK